MSDSIEERRRYWSNFYIQIVESPDADSLFDGRTEGRMLSEALRLAEVKSRYRLAVDRERFTRALSQDLGDAVKNGYGLPLLHISAHGNENEIALTDGTRLSWEDLRKLVLPINRALSGRLGLCMSTCYGASACQAAMGEDPELPFWFVLGPAKSGNWSDLAISFAAFYNRLFRGEHPRIAFDTMSAGSEEPSFLMVGAQFIRDEWDRHLQSKRRESG